MLTDLLHQKTYNKIKQANNILLVCHEKPDGDAVASVCAMIDFLASLNKKYTAYCTDLPGSNLLFLPHAEKIQAQYDFIFADFDLILVFDCAQLERTKLTAEITNKNINQFVVNFDHHPQVDNFADLDLKNPHAASTTEIVYDFFAANQIEITKNMATCILTGISVDTGSFVYQATSSKTMDISSLMLRRGAKMNEILSNVWKNKKTSTLNILGLVMARIKINKKYNLAYSVLTAAETAGVPEEEFDGIASIISTLANVKGVIFLREYMTGVIKGSIRSNHPQADISLLAHFLGGGGHAKASGFFMKGQLIKNSGHWQIT